ncbi:FAA hydrolase family protein [Pseudoalteromonas lipolytica]|jgi:2-keto-4-pentenoate hydratase/2-oxohepta-3-ene-1,7-dioic acid hydratase in catechol pathway|uniref:FAA hydrolase family protein n=1 Tax=Pseudoalteromonas lipolytica TaxID=570156 RepID=A0AAD0WD53_9GAMM|nr:MULTISPECIES: fumarylacetoacetate hydrolase family protein [Pseudoalteromonas]AXV66099.1 FAA hydrolase family protein [Pseudoalteromonas donghaensis]
MHSVKFVNEIVTPSKVVCVGRNYAAHIAELNNETPTSMVLFVKPNSALTQSLYAKHGSEQLHYEAELCFLVKNKQLAGVGLGLDLTKRDLQTQLKQKSLPWERAKAFDGAALFTEFVPVNESGQYQFSLHIDGKLAQLGDTQLMIHTAQQILAEINEFMSLQDGDIIMTGTPEGVGKVISGATFNVALKDDTTQVLTHQWQAI